MISNEWVEELFPGTFVVGHGSDTGGNQTVIIDKDDKHYALMCDGFDYGAWIGLRIELTKEERDKAIAEAKPRSLLVISTCPALISVSSRVTVPTRVAPS